MQSILYYILLIQNKGNYFGSNRSKGCSCGKRIANWKRDANGQWRVSHLSATGILADITISLSKPAYLLVHASMHGVVPTSYGQTHEVKSKRVLGTRKSGYAYLVPGLPEFTRRWGWGRDIGNGRRKKGPNWDEMSVAKSMSLTETTRSILFCRLMGSIVSDTWMVMIFPRNTWFWVFHKGISNSDDDDDPIPVFMKYQWRDQSQNQKSRRIIVKKLIIFIYY